LSEGIYPVEARRMAHTLLNMWRARNFGRIDHELTLHRSEPDEALNELEWKVRRWV
jgi:hypothetical protein